MKNYKRIMAITLTATMVMGSSVAAFAADGGNSSIGTGYNEGHVDKRVLSVTLPTVATDATPFNYTVDPERLVPATSGSRYGNTTFTEDAKRDGVYFLNTTAATPDSYNEITIADQDELDEGEFYEEDTDSPGTYIEATTYDAGTTYYTKTPGSAETSKYDNKSASLTVSSQSSSDVELTVEVAVEDDASVTLVDEKPSTDGYSEVTVDSAEVFAEGTYYTKAGSTYTKATQFDDEATYYEVSDAELYLALMVGSDETVLKAGETAKKTVTIAGIDSNFETSYDSESGTYAYAVKADPITPWNTSSFYLTGVASKASAKNVTVPKLTVTWSWTDPADETDETVNAAPTISSITGFAKANPNNVVITFTSGSGTDAVEADGVRLLQGATDIAVNTAKYTVDMDAKTITIDKSAGFLNSATANVPIKVVLTNGGEDVVTLSGTITIG